MDVRENRELYENLKFLEAYPFGNGRCRFGH